jgi:hypothetical protein
LKTRELLNWLVVATAPRQRRTCGVERPLVEAMGGIATVTTFDDAGIFSSSDGLVLRSVDGDEFQITLVQTDFANRPSRKEFR